MWWLLEQLHLYSNHPALQPQDLDLLLKSVVSEHVSEQNILFEHNKSFGINAFRVSGSSCSSVFICARWTGIRCGWLRNMCGWRVCVWLEGMCG